MYRLLSKHGRTHPHANYYYPAIEKNRQKTESTSFIASSIWFDLENGWALLINRIKRDQYGLKIKGEEPKKKLTNRRERNISKIVFASDFIFFKQQCRGCSCFRQRLVVSYSLVFLFQIAFKIGYLHDDDKLCSWGSFHFSSIVITYFLCAMRQTNLTSIVTRELSFTPSINITCKYLSTKLYEFKI